MLIKSTSQSKITLTFQVGNLNLESESTISIAVYSPQTQTHQEFCRIESSVYENNPNWSTSVSINYNFSVVQPISLKIQNSQGESQKSFTSTLGKLLTSNSNNFYLNDSSTEFIKIHFTESKSTQEKVNLHLRAHNVDKMDFFGKSDPYLVLFKQINGAWIQICKSEVIKKTLDPIWKPFQLTMQSLCDGNQETLIKFEVWDWDRGTKDDFIGSAEIRVFQMASPACRLDLINPTKQKKKKKKYSNSGILEIINFEIMQKYSIVNYLQSGFKINLLFAIDFTSSNLDYSTPTSLHNLNSDNYYIKLMKTFGKVVEQYDPDQLFAVFGFGGEPAWTRKLDHCFAFNGNPDSPFIKGLENVIKSYEQVVPNVRLAGPTLTAPVIFNANSISASFDADRSYYLLIVMIDGVSIDLQQTAEALVHSSFLPLSVIFVGVGPESFAAMDQLMLFPLIEESGKVAKRQNAQFAELKKFNNSAEKLVESILENIPKEIEEFMEFLRLIPS